jgi:hypothetical protein
LKYFATREAAESQRDAWEGADEVFAQGTVQLIAENRTAGVPLEFQRIVITPDRFTDHLRYASDRTSSLYVYCMYALLESSMDEQLRDAQQLGLGDWSVAIHRPDLFRERIRESAALVGLSLELQFVDYVDEANFSGPIGPFRKRRSFARQSEARITLAPGGLEPLTLEVGDLSDIVGPVYGIHDLRPASNESAQRSDIACPAEDAR